MEEIVNKILEKLNKKMAYSLEDKSWYLFEEDIKNVWTKISNDYARHLIHRILGENDYLKIKTLSRYNQLFTLIKNNLTVLKLIGEKIDWRPGNSDLCKKINLPGYQYNYPKRTWMLNGKPLDRQKVADHISTQLDEILINPTKKEVISLLTWIEMEGLYG